MRPSLFASSLLVKLARFVLSLPVGTCDNAMANLRRGYRPERLRAAGQVQTCGSAVRAVGPIVLADRPSAFTAARRRFGQRRD